MMYPLIPTQRPAALLLSIYYSLLAQLLNPFFSFFLYRIPSRALSILLFWPPDPAAMEKQSFLVAGLYCQCG